MKENKNSSSIFSSIESLNKNDLKWLKMYGYACQYYSEYGDLLISRSYKITDCENEIKLGIWIQSQRNAYRDGRISNEKINLLESIGMSWKVNAQDKWMKMYEYAREYYKEYNNLLIPRSYIIVKEGQKIKLGSWIHAQRDGYENRVLSKERIELLESIGMAWQAYDYNWLKMYAYASEYYQKHNNLLIPRSYIIIKQDQEIKLGIWIHAQRRDYRNNKISQERIELLESIGMVWNIRKKTNSTYVDYSQEIIKENHPKQLIKNPKNQQ